MVIAEVRADASVLVVEDNRDLCENLAEILGGHGYRVVTALTARRAVEFARAAPPDVALIDLNLPDGRGMDVIAEIARVSPETACVILTGNASLESAVEAVNRGAYAYLLKGGRVEDVVSTVERAAEKVGLEREKRRLERELREERNFSRAIVSNAALGIAVIAPSGRVLELNRRMRDLLRGAVQGIATVADLARLARDQASRERMARALSPAGASSAPGHEGGVRGETRLSPPGVEVEVEVVRPDGGPGIWTISSSVVTGEGGRADAVVAVFDDVTAERELQRRVLEASRLAAVGEMAARVAHEIRNPLAGIAGAISILSRGFEGDAKREAFAKELLALVGRLNRFVEDLLVHARPLRIQKEDVSLGAVLDPVLAVLREHPLAREVAVEVDDRLGRPLRADPHYLGMALQNLILNAAQASKGKAKVRIEAERAPDGAATITVSDDGPGLPPEILPHRIFEAFATTRVEGTGLGLSTTRRILEAQGGTISAENRPEGGARFAIRIPA